MGLRILHVDDDYMGSRRAAKVLKRYSTVDHACDGNEAIQKLKDGKYDLVVSDWNFEQNRKFFGYLKQLENQPTTVLLTNSHEGGISKDVKSIVEGSFPKGMLSKIVGWLDEKYG